MSTTVLDSSRTFPEGHSRAQNIGLWVMQLLLAFVFLGAGWAKISGAEEMVQTFEVLGVGQWFRLLTGGIEVTAALLLLMPRLAGFGALLLVGTMAGGVATHLFTQVGGSPVPALVLGLLAAVVLWGRRRRVLAALGR